MRQEIGKKQNDRIRMDDELTFSDRLRPGRNLSKKYSLIPLLLFFLFIPSLTYSTTEYAEQTGLDYLKCHVDATGGSRLTKAGENFKEDLRSRGAYRALHPFRRWFV
jgi:hypothetical protein